MKIVFLGTGTSHGVPPLDCMMDDYVRCKRDVCRLSQSDPKHARTRSSLFVEWNGVNICIDVSLDFRQQALREKIKRIDAVLITHGHADHIGGIPDLRSYTRPKVPAPQKRDCLKMQASTGTKPVEALPLYGSPETIGSIRRSYGYIFEPGTFEGGGIPRIDTREVRGTFEVSGNRVAPIAVRHGDLGGCLGYRLGPLVYIPDMKSITDAEAQKCAGAELLVLNCLRVEREHVSHLILPESMALARRIGPKRCYFIHMCHDIHYKTHSETLDSWMGFSFDGMAVEL